MCVSVQMPLAVIRGTWSERSYSLKAAERGGDDDDDSAFSPAELTCALGDAFRRAYLNMVITTWSVSL